MSTAQITPVNEAQIRRESSSKMWVHVGGASQEDLQTETSSAYMWSEENHAWVRRGGHRIILVDELFESLEDNPMDVYGKRAKGQNALWTTVNSKNVDGPKSRDCNKFHKIWAAALMRQASDCGSQSRAGSHSSILDDFRTGFCPHLAWQITTPVILRTMTTALAVFS
ncbi:MAG: hypothetical protein MMC23_004543 [Stictis urceolatum]|nr:hypothetical protein [Stictis urceolata]